MNNQCLLGSFFQPKPCILEFQIPNVNISPVLLQLRLNLQSIVSFPTLSCSRTRLLQNADSENNNKMSGVHVRVDCPVIYHTFSTLCLHSKVCVLPLPCIVIWNNDFIPYIFFEWTWQAQGELLLIAMQVIKISLEMTSMLQNMITSF